MSTNQVLKYINEINCNRVSGGDISTKIIKIAKEELTVPIGSCINQSILSSTFPDELKIIDIISVYKNQDANYLTKLLPIILKVLEKVPYSQLETVVNKIFSPKLCEFRKEHSCMLF